jgi:hypothetical protein
VLRDFVDEIERANAQRPFLNTRSRGFLGSLCKRCDDYDTVFVSERQFAWFIDLIRDARCL